jgi:hypothetical protein
MGKCTAFYATDLRTFVGKKNLPLHCTEQIKTHICSPSFNGPLTQAHFTVGTTWACASRLWGSPCGAPSSQHNSAEKNLFSKDLLEDLRGVDWRQKASEIRTKQQGKAF